MNSINSLTSLSAKTGIGGLVSGMDIDELVQSLTSTGRERIIKQQQKVQKLEWKQTGYRTVIDSLKDFQSSYLDVLSSTNLKNPSFFNTIRASYDSSAINARTTSASHEGTITIDIITQLATNQSIKSKQGVSSKLQGTPLTDTLPELLTKIEGNSIAIHLDGKVKTITFDQGFINGANVDGLGPALQDKTDDAFGIKNIEDRIIDVSFADGQLSMSAEGSHLSLYNIGDDDALASLGFANGQSNKILSSQQLDSISLATPLHSGEDGIFSFAINSVDFKFDTTTSLSSVIDTINSSGAGVTITYSSVTDTFTLVSKECGVGENIVIDETGGNLLSAFGLNGDLAEVTYGKNALLSINGQAISRSSNMIHIDGVNIDLLATTEETAEPINIALQTDPNSIVNPIKDFIEAYNTMIDLLHGLAKESVYSGYPPLSDAQKDEMSETEIEKWEEKAKSGVLRGDGLLRNITSKLQTAMISTVEKGGMSLYDMGITSAGYQENGKLKIDEIKLTEALRTRGNEISNFFTSENGLGNILDDIITAASKTTGIKGQRGSLVEMAGVESTRSSRENSIFLKIEMANKNIEMLQLRLTSEESRLWRQFTAMETAIQRLNEQSMILSQFGSRAQG